MRVNGYVDIRSLNGSGLCVLVCAGEKKGVSVCLRSNGGELFVLGRLGRWLESIFFLNDFFFFFWRASPQKEERISSELPVSKRRVGWSVRIGTRTLLSNIDR